MMHDDVLWMMRDEALSMRAEDIVGKAKGKIPSKRFFLVAQLRIFDHGEGRYIGLI